MARWKSGLFPLAVFAISVNWETQRISPPMSLTFLFHMFSVTSEKTRSERLERNERGAVSSESFTFRKGRMMYIFLVRISTSEAVSSVLGNSYVQPAHSPTE